MGGVVSSAAKATGTNETNIKMARITEHKRFIIGRPPVIYPKIVSRLLETSGKAEGMVFRIFVLCSIL
jgi:hypothetical protein